MNSRGAPVVLTADRILMAEHRTLFAGMVAAAQTTTTPRILMDHVLAPRGRHTAPMGLRRIEAALLGDGFDADDVAVVHGDALPDAIGPNTRIIGVSAGEACGLGMNSTTMTAISGGEIYARRLVRELMERIARLKTRAPHASVVMGGPGTWQLLADDELRRDLGVDHVVTGHAEGNVARLFHRIADGEGGPPILHGEPISASQIPSIRGPSTMGVVELSRGCGMGCTYCTMGRVPMQHLPEETILADVETNLAAGVRSISAISEDMLRYGANGRDTNPEALLGLLRAMRKLDGLGLVQTDHANVISVAGFSDDELRELRELMVGDTGCELPWINLGVEAASGELLARSGSAKLGDVDPADWGDFCATQIRRLIRAGFLPMASLMMGLPGERPEHVRASVDWVEALAHEPLTVFPVLYAPIDGAATPGRRDLTPAHWELIDRCYDVNFREVPRMVWDNQRAAGVGVGRRMLMQMLGRGQIVQWKMLLAYHAWRSAR